MSTAVIERRDRTFKGRVWRATWPIFNFAEHAPCIVLGHRWREIPPSQLTPRERQAGKMHFKCSRPSCGLRCGFTN